MIWHPSPNFGERRDGLTPSLVVIHYTAMEGAEAARDWLCNPDAEVSAHYVIARDGTCWHLVEEAMRAWHAGAGSWAGQGDVNSRSIGIELCNTGFEPFGAPQMAALEELLQSIRARWGIREVIGHSDMAPGRKIDPGPRFDWLRLERQGLAPARGQGPGPRDGSEEMFRRAAVAAGYSSDVDFETLLAAVRLRYRPGAVGPLAPEDFAPLGHAALWT